MPEGGVRGVVRPQRLRRSAGLRRLVAEHRLAPADLVAPLFVRTGLIEPRDVVSLPGVRQDTPDSVRRSAAAAAEAGVGGLLLFGVVGPEDKDGRGSQADAEDGPVARALADVRAEVGDAVVLAADVCLDEYTDHGHCGVLRDDGSMDVDATLERYAATAGVYGAAGADVVAPSGMVDGQVAAVRAGLAAAGADDVAVLSYAVKYASAMYGPFRDVAECAPAFGDRSSHQADPARGHGEAVAEALLDVAEGADALMVKPAVPYLDVVARVADAVDVPVAAYVVSGETSAVEAAAANGWLDRDRVVRELLLSCRRAGASVLVTYWAVEVARRLREGSLEP